MVYPCVFQHSQSYLQEQKQFKKQKHLISPKLTKTPHQQLGQIPGYFSVYEVGKHKSLIINC